MIYKLGYNSNTSLKETVLHKFMLTSCLNQDKIIGRKMTVY